MFGTFQTSHLRIEVPASERTLRQSLLHSDSLRQWLAPIRLSSGLPDRLQPNMAYTSWIGPLAIQHRVERVEDAALRLILSQGIDGFHEWQWGDGWVQSRLEGISLLPLNLGHTASLLQLKRFLIVAHSESN
jgi:hypothetical protein